MWIVFLSGLFAFLTSYWDFISFDRGYFTEKCKIIVISGSSLIFLLSFVFLIWAFILINSNNNGGGVSLNKKKNKKDKKDDCCKK